MKYVPLLLLTFLLGPLLQGQTISSSVLALAGGLEKSPSGLSMSWTLGEIIIDPLRTTEVILTQGFQQPNASMRTGFVDPSWEHSIQVYPNPTAGHLVLSTTANHPLRFRMVDAKGVLIKESDWQISMDLDVQHLPTGSYAVSIFDDGKLVSSKILLKQ